MPLSLFGGQVHDFDAAAHAAVPKGLKVHVSIFCSGCGEVTRFWTARRQTAFKMRRGTRRWRHYASSGGQENHLWLSQGLGRRQRLSLEQIAPDPFRGWGRYLSAHIRAQKEPVVSPAGTGGEHRRPRRVSWHLAHKAPGDPSGRT